MRIFSTLLFTLLCSCFFSVDVSSLAAATDPYTPQNFVSLTNPDWSKNAILYELNTRQFSSEGTFKAAEKQLPRLKTLGIDIIWLMPINPIGIKNRKGTLGSPYSVRDYRAVNPEFGTLEDLKSFVSAAHRFGMHVILDWVANHTAWDNALVDDHPDYYDHDWKGAFHPTPWRDWSDIIDLDYSHAGLRRYMADSMSYWVKTADIDGFRCDVAGYVPVDFWNTVRKNLSAIKPVFMLAEWDTRDLHAAAFDATYSWAWYNTVKDIAQGKADATALYTYYADTARSYPREAMRMTYIENHDKNAWDGSMYDIFGDAIQVTAVLSVVGEGIPLIYNGVEAGNHKRLAFFDKDPIVWRDDPMRKLFTNLIAFKKANSSLWNGQWGARMIKVDNSAEGKIFSFIRRGQGNTVLAVLNLTKNPQTFLLDKQLSPGDYKDFATHEAVNINDKTMMTLPAWGYKLLSR